MRLGRRDGDTTGYKKNLTSLEKAISYVKNGEELDFNFD